MGGWGRKGRITDIIKTVPIWSNKSFLKDDSKKV